MLDGYHLPDLTPREQDVSSLLLAGSSNKEIAGCLHITVGTVQNILSTMYTKYDTRNRTDLVAKLLKNGKIRL